MKTIAPLLLLMLVTGCSGGPGPAGTDKTPSPTPSYAPRRVVTETAKLEEMSTTIKLSGQVVPTEDRAVLLTAPLDGVISKPTVRIGDFVRQDQILAEFNSVYGQTSMQVLDKLESLESTTIQSQSQLAQTLTTLAQSRSAYGDASSKVAGFKAGLVQAQADLTLAEVDLRRKKELFAAGVFARADVEQSQDTYDKAKAAVAMNREQLSISKEQVPLAKDVVGQAGQAVGVAKDSFLLNRSANDRYRSVLSQSKLVGAGIPSELTRLRVGESNSSVAAASQSFPIRSPITGVVVEWTATPGQRVPNGTQIGKVVDLAEVYVDANAFESDIGSVREGDHLEVVSSSSPGRIFKGRVRYVGRQVNSDTRALQVRSLIENPSSILRPNMFVDVTIERPARSHVIVIPSKALITLGSDDFVMVEEKPEKYRKQKVTVGVRSGDKIEISSGLKPGERVVTEGNLLLDEKE